MARGGAQPARGGRGRGGGRGGASAAPVVAPAGGNGDLPPSIAHVNSDYWAKVAGWAELMNQCDILKDIADDNPLTLKEGAVQVQLPAARAIPHSSRVFATQVALILMFGLPQSHFVRAAASLGQRVSKVSVESYSFAIQGSLQLGGVQGQLRPCHGRG